MPIHLASVSRREFLRTVTVTSAGLLAVRHMTAAEQGDTDLLALLADTHVPSDRKISSDNGTNMTDNLEHVIAELLALERRPAGVVINGDCAYLQGLSEDYKNLAKTLAPLSDANLPVHLTMGNHDHRQRMYDELKAQRPEKLIIEGKHVSLLQMPRANWYLLDSLKETDVVTGELGKAQFAWLLQTLDANADKPAIIMAHHHPQWQASDPIAGLRETTELFEALGARKQVKAYIFGHTHRWEITEHEGIHLVNLPPTAYVFDKERPNGWVAADVGAQGMTLQISTLDKKHDENGRRVDLAWR